MQIAPLSLITKEAQSPNQLTKRNDSLIFSITSEKFNSRKETLLLQESKQMHNNQIQQPALRDYFKIQDKIKSLQEKVENIKTNYYHESEGKSLSQKDKENRPEIINIDLEFPEEIYERKLFVKQNEEQQSEIGKIKRKKSKYYTGVEQKTRQKSRSNTKNEESNVSTKRNNLTTLNINDFSAYRTKNSSFRHNQTGLSIKQHSRDRSSSFSVKKRQDSFLQNNNNKATELNRMKQELHKNRVSNEKLSRKSRESLKKLSMHKDETRKLRQQNSALQKQVAVMKKQLKKSETIKDRQKQTIQKQKQEIEELKGFLEEFLKRNANKNDDGVILVNEKEKEGKITKLRMLR